MQRLRPRTTIYFAILTAVLIGLRSTAHAQAGRYGRRAAPAQQPQQAQPPEQEILRVRDFSGLGSRNLVETPEYDTNIPRGTARPKEWLRIATEYDTAPEWIDEITFQYFAMSLRAVEGVPQWSIFRMTVRYTDVAEGRGHVSTAFLHPRALERYGEVVAVAVEILHEGTVIAEAADVEGGQNIPEDWWRNPVVTGNENVTTRNGYLLDRSQSPFALINIDDFEFIK